MRELKLTRAKLARKAGCPRSLITELLETSSEKRQRHATTYLPDIHKALEWPEPQSPLAAGMVPELAYLFERLDETGRSNVIASARKELDRLLADTQSKRAAKKP